MSTEREQVHVDGYVAPQIVVLGTVQDITQGGSNPLTDGNGPAS